MNATNATNGTRKGSKKDADDNIRPRQEVSDAITATESKEPVAPVAPVAPVIMMDDDDAAEFSVVKKEQRKKAKEAKKESKRSQDVQLAKIAIRLYIAEKQKDERWSGRSESALVRSFFRPFVLAADGQSRKRRFTFPADFAHVSNGAPPVCEWWKKAHADPSIRVRAAAGTFLPFPVLAKWKQAVSALNDTSSATTGNKLAAFVRDMTGADADELYNIVRNTLANANPSNGDKRRAKRYRGIIAALLPILREAPTFHRFAELADVQPVAMEARSSRT